MTHLLRFTFHYAMARLWFAVVLPLLVIVAGVLAIMAIGAGVQVWRAVGPLLS